jgi:hypothetical protein
MSNAQVERALSYLLSAKQTKRHFSCQPDDENNRKLKKHQLGVLKALFEQFPDDVRLLAKEKYDQRD